MLNNDHIVFDLDDTLYKEKTYVESALRFAGTHLNSLLETDGIEAQLLQMFDEGCTDSIGVVCDEYKLSNHTKRNLIEKMRSHTPSIRLSEDAVQLLTFIRDNRLNFSILTDGRSVTQRSKISALGIDDAKVIIISEELGEGKPSLNGFRQIERATNTLGSHVYVGDNLKKDFLAPNALGWKTIHLVDNGQNIHKKPTTLYSGQKAQHSVHLLTEIPNLLA